MPAYAVVSNPTEPEGKKLDCFLRFYIHHRKLSDGVWLITSDLDSFDLRAAIAGTIDVPYSCLEIWDLIGHAWPHQIPTQEIESFREASRDIEVSRRSVAA